MSHNRSLASEVGQTWIQIAFVFSLGPDECHVTFLPQFPHPMIEIPDREAPGPGQAMWETPSGLSLPGMMAVLHSCSIGQSLPAHSSWPLFLPLHTHALVPQFPGVDMPSLTFIYPSCG